MGLWDKLKAGTKKAKIQGELVLLDREVKNRKLAFGVELYDLLESDEKSFTGGSVMMSSIASSKSGSVLHLQQSHLNGPYTAAKKDIQELETQQRNMRNEQELCQVSRTRGDPASSPGEKLAKAGQWVSSNATETKLEAQIKLLDREIHRRKELFGLEAYDSYVATGKCEPESHSLKGVKGSIRERLSARVAQYNPKEKRIQECLDRSKNAINMLVRQQELKRKEIQALDEILHAPKETATSTISQSAS